MANETSGAANRRGCFAVVALVAIALLLLAAIGFGWVGQVERGKITDLPVPAANQS